MRWFIRGATILIACAAPAASAPAGAEGQPPTWKLAVVFQRRDGGRSYVGTVQRLQPSAALSGPAVMPVRSGGWMGYTHEIWLAADGVSRGFWYSPERGIYGDLTPGGQPGPPRRDDGTLQRLAMAARPAAPRLPRKPDTVGVADSFFHPEKLYALCAGADAIIVGRVAGIQREGRDLDSPTGVLQYTVFVVAVEEYLKGGDERTIPIVKLANAGGTLPWHEPTLGVRGVGSEFTDTPLLEVGGRYILFLTIPRIGPRDRTDGERDEVIGSGGTLGSYYLKNGFTHAPEPAWRPITRGAPKVRRFGSGLGSPVSPTTLDEIPERMAIGCIQRAVAEGARGR